MKVGAENKTKLYAMVALLVLAVIMLTRGFWSSSTPTATANGASPTVPAQPEAANDTTRTRTKAAPLDPTLQADLLKNSEGAEYKGSGRNIFEEQAPPPIIQPQQSVVREQTPPQPAPPPPPAPIPLKFFGYANKPGQPKTIFLANGEDVFIGKEGDIVNRRYKIVHISPSQVEIEDVLNNNRQTIPLTQG
jgi:hypothetical protein